MIEGTWFVRDDTGQEIQFNDLTLPIEEWTTEVEARASKRNKHRRHGGWKSGTYLGERIWRYSGSVNGRNAAEYVQLRLDINGLLMPGRLNDDPIIGKLFVMLAGQSETFRQGCTIESWSEFPVQALSPSRGSYMIAFRMFDPWFLGEERIVTATVSTTEQGYTYDYTYNMTYPITASMPNEVSIHNAGNAPTPPVVVFHGPSADPQIIRRAGSDIKYFRLEGVTLANYNDTVTVNMDDNERSVIRDSSGDNLYDFARGDWWTLQPKDNFVRYYSKTGQPGSAAEIKWQNAYML